MIVKKTSKAAFNKSIDLRKSADYVKGVRMIIQSEFNKFKQELIRDFKKHPVTREIEMGPNGKNISNTLGGEGNLFSFIGFEANEKPTYPILQSLEAIFLQSVNIKKDGSSITFIQYPKAENIFAITPLPWANGRSWAKGIEQGMSGLGFYLNKQSTSSRSGTGIQSSKKIRKLKFSNMPYISSLIKKFEYNILTLNRKTF